MSLFLMNGQMELMKRNKLVLMILLLTFCLTQGQAETLSDTSRIIRIKRAPYHITSLKLINRSGKNAMVYFMDPYTHQQRFYFRLRLNEKNNIRTTIGATFLASDNDGETLYMNNRQNYLVHPSQGGKQIEVVVTSREKLSHKERLINLPSIQDVYIEVMVFCDFSFLQKHNSDRDLTRYYIIALMKSVRSIFEDKSLGVDLHVVLKDVHIMEDDESPFAIPRSQPKTAMGNACKYMLNMKRQSNKHFDFGIFLTRKLFGFTGYTPLYRMCVPLRSCTLIQDTEFQTAFVIAHEIAHSIGVSHDGDYNNCGDNAGRGSVMAAVIYSKFLDFHWSNCTRLQMKENLNYFPCIHNKPHDFISLNDTLPGSDVPLTRQCEIYFTKGYSPCLGLRSPDEHCKAVYCKLPDKQRNLCRYYSLAPLDGTECADNMWCVQGKCLPIGQLLPQAINGGWSPWQQWSECSCSCGRGVKFRERTCNNPVPKFKGLDCMGPSKDWDVCYKEMCSIQLTFEDLRHETCSTQLMDDQWTWLSDKDGRLKMEALGLNCTFENNDICKWHNPSNVKEQWVLGRGNAPNQNSGPNVDHTNQNVTGTYLYLKPFTPEIQRVQLFSPSLTLPQICLRFYYNMFGEDVGSLRVVVETAHKTREVWKRSENYGDAWRFGYTDVAEETKYNIIIEAESHTSNISHVAIDDITTTYGRCFPEPQSSSSCRFSCHNAQTKESRVDLQAPDGHPCDHDIQNICVNGKCEVLGCDGVKNSTYTLDECLVCGGNGTSCIKSTGIMEIKPTSVTETLLNIPPGSTHVVVKKLTSSPGNLAVRDLSGFHLYRRPPTWYHWHYFTTANTTFRYLIRNQTQHIYGGRQLTSHFISIQIMYSHKRFIPTQPIKIYFEFYAKKSQDSYIWKVVNRTACNATCNGGISVGRFACVSLFKTSPVERTSCSPANVIVKDEIVTCNTRPCSVRHFYKYTNWSKCSMCDVIGDRHRNVSCWMKHERLPAAEVALDRCEQPVPDASLVCFVRCPKACVERSHNCPSFVAKGFCKHKPVRNLCCKSCKL